MKRIEAMKKDPRERVDLEAGALGVIVANRIAKARRASKLSVDEFAHRLGVSARTARAIEFGPYRGSLRRLVEIADRLGVNVSVDLKRR